MENERTNRPNGGYKSRNTEHHYQKSNNGQNYSKTDRKPGTGYQGKREGQSVTSYSKGQKSYPPRKPGYFQRNKDDDDDDNRRPGDMKKKSSQNSSKDKVREPQPDKMDIAKRFEKEKKIIQKKQLESKKNHSQPVKPQARVKRSNNIDWTREYENDSYDDDDMFLY